ncbi:class I SAM-dependent methyltransferase, partial [Candidatus Woesearchaeota archaeon]|nr:class I SAM-dependent methyltransferase [Candidatus Woesearchaeota archaeon]
MKHFPILSPDLETQFLCGLLELQYGEVNLQKMQKLASQVSWAKGWPRKKEAFWNAEAFLWKKKIDSEKRELIRKEIIFFMKGKNKEKIFEKESKNKEKILEKEKMNLDLGCGAYSYLPSVGFDCSQEMLKLNEQCSRKVVGDVEKILPFADEEFSSVTAVFVLNYVENYSLLLSEIFRVLKSGGNGKFVMVLAEKGVNDWQRQKEVNHFPAEKWG